MMKPELESRPRRVLLLETDAQQRALWAVALNQRQFAVRAPTVVRDPQFALGLLKAAGDPPSLVIASMAYFSALNRNPYQFTKLIANCFPEAAVAITHVAGNEVTEPMRAVARRYGAIDLLPAMTDATGAAGALDVLWFSVCAQTSGKPVSVAPVLSLPQKVAVQLRTSLARDNAVAIDGTFEATAALKSAAKFSSSVDEFVSWMNQLVAEGSLVSLHGETAFSATSGTWRFFVEMPVQLASSGIFVEAARNPRSIEGIDLRALASDMIEGDKPLEIKDRSFRFKQYPACFVGSEAVDWLVRHQGISRPLATRLGERLFESGLLRHVVDDQPFKDGNFFYRFVLGPDTRTDAKAQDLDGFHLRDVVAAMQAPGGVSIADRRFRLKTYPACFIGKAATDWLMQRYRLSRPLAVKLGERLVAAGLVRHVLDEHDFKDADYFYRFA